MSWLKRGAAACFVLSIGLFASASSGVTLNFDPSTDAPPGDLPSSLSTMGNSPGSLVASTAEISNQYDSDGVLVSSTEPFIAVVDIGSGVASPTNGIGGVATGDLLSYADPVKHTFVVPGTSNPGVT